MPLTFDHFFRAATGGNTPYDYQRRLVGGESGRTAGGDAGTPCTSRLISIPIGLGRNDGIISRHSTT